MAQNDPGAVRQAAMEYLRKKGVKPTGENLTRAIEFLSKADTPLARDNASASREETTKTAKKPKTKSKADKKPTAQSTPAFQENDFASGDDYDALVMQNGRYLSQQGADKYLMTHPFDTSEDYSGDEGGLEQLWPGLAGGAGGALLASMLMRRGRGPSASDPRAAGMSPMEGEVLPPRSMVPAGQSTPLDRSMTLDARQIPGDNALMYDPMLMLGNDYIPDVNGAGVAEGSMEDMFGGERSLPGTARGQAMGMQSAPTDPYYDMSMLGGGTGVRGGMLPGARNGQIGALIEAIMEKRMQQQALANSMRGGGGGYPRQMVDPSMGPGPDAATSGVTRKAPTEAEILDPQTLKALFRNAF